jgi:hypothetical protein
VISLQAQNGRAVRTDYLDRPPRAGAYVRVSDEGGRGDDLTSPQIQMTAIGNHCARRGYGRVLVLEHIDRTGRVWKCTTELEAAR